MSTGNLANSCSFSSVVVRCYNNNNNTNNNNNNNNNINNINNILSVSNEYLSCRFGCIIEPTGFIMNKHTYIIYYQISVMLCLLCC